MKIHSTLSFIFSISLLLFIGLGCNTLDSLTERDEPPLPPPSVSSEKEIAGQVETEDNETISDISGKYSATGTNINGGGKYNADLLITKRAAVYQFSWDSNGNKYEGVGVQNGKKIAVAFADGANGKGCGVILYKINSDGSLNGKTGYWGANEIESETATRTGGSDLEGEYSVNGKNLKGEDYEMNLTVNKQNDGYKFFWQGNRNWEGFGIKQGDTVSVGFGGEKCGFVAYEIKSDGSLEGKWGGRNSTSFGTEKAKKN